jgi:glutamate-ammonia-ligase adenylyltransferase
MGYASDLELLFVYDESDRTEGTGFEGGRFFDDVVRETVALLQAPAQALFRPDLRLRPHGNKGPLASPMASLGDYYRPGGGALPFERQALVKLRFVAGDETLGRRVEGLRDAFVWSGEPWDREASLRLRERQARELVPAGRFNVKLSRGGLVDAEYAVQYLQIVAGKDRPELRTPRTLMALDRLATAGLVSAGEHTELRDGYLFWRQVVDALRVVRGHSEDLLLPQQDSDDYGFLARRLGYPGERRRAAQALAVDVARHRERLAALYDRRFGYAGEVPPIA